MPPSTRHLETFARIRFATRWDVTKLPAALGFPTPLGDVPRARALAVANPLATSVRFATVFTIIKLMVVLGSPFSERRLEGTEIQEGTRAPAVANPLAA